ncbi:CRAL-TRIO domain-containing protein, partial [Cladochytrium replicatum]
LWGVDLSDVNPDSISKKHAVVFLKFLRAREFRVADAKDMLVNTLNWRKEFDMKKLEDEKFSSVFNDLGLIYGTDKNGKPITYNFYGSIGQEEIYNNPEKFLRWRIQLMEKAIALLDFENGLETVTQVHDYEGASLFLDKRIKAVSTQIIKIFQDHYPEMLEKKFFIGVPTLMEYLFSLFSSFVSKATRDKFIVVSKARTRATLLEHIAPNQLPARYGG